MIKTKLLASAAVATALIGTAPAALSNTYVRQVLDGHPVTKRLKQAGIKVVYKQTCKQKGIAGQALYVGTHQAIVLCMNAINGDTTMAIEALKHEAIHASQYCWHADYDSIYQIKGWKEIARKEGSDFNYANKMSRGDDSEWEAYYLEDAPDKAVVAIINETCGDIKELMQEVGGV